MVSLARYGPLSHLSVMLFGYGAIGLDFCSHTSDFEGPASDLNFSLPFHPYLEAQLTA